MAPAALHLPTLLVIALSAILNLLGITESALVAFIIFATHMTTMAILIILSIVKTIEDLPTITVFLSGTGDATPINGTDFGNASASLPMNVSNVYLIEYNWKYTEPQQYGMLSCSLAGSHMRLPMNSQYQAHSRLNRLSNL